MENKNDFGSLHVGTIGAGLDPRTVILEMRAATAKIEDPVKRTKQERALDIASVIMSAAEDTMKAAKAYSRLHKKRIFRPKDRRPRKRLEKKKAAADLALKPVFSALQLARVLSQPVPKKV